MVADRARNPMTELRRGTIAFCVLALLDDRERYAVELVGALTENRALATGAGTIYPLLSRLREEKLVASTWQESPAGPPRRYYRLTASGRRSLEAFRGEWAQFRDAVDQLLTQKAS
ncbi:PadR family transcriptional regulator [Rugosimonospora acidiphila]